MSKTAGKDSCDGDSGGPLVALEAGDGGGGVGGDVMYLVGVISFGTQSCGIGVPGSEVENEMEAKYRSSFFSSLAAAFANVGNYVNWIVSHLQD